MMKRDKSLLKSKGKMSSSMSEANLEKKFQTATNTQDSIQTLSLWVLHHKAHHQKIVGSWMKVLQKAKISHRLTLFYLANDVVQNSKRKGFLQFVNSFAEVLREATLLVRDDSIRPSIQRVFNIWEQRNVYTPEFIADLRAILANSKVPASAPAKLLAQFKPDSVINKIRNVSKLDVEIDKKMKSINLSKLKATDAEIVQQFKDRIHGQKFKRDFDDSVTRLEELIKLLEKEMTERAELILLLEQSEIYYDTQKGEAKIVANAYKNFGARIDKLQKKLEEIHSNLPSPIPSPSVDAPSPTTSDQELELKLPSENPLERDLENAPSPVGSPEGLNLPESGEDDEAGTKTVGNPIPTLSNFFSHEDKGMTSWLDAFSSKKDSLKILSEKSEMKKDDSSSLDSRLSNLMQNMPSLPASLQNTLFGTNSLSGNNSNMGETVEPKASIKKDSSSISSILTPVKDDYSGQNTPLQDEDTHSGHAFFSKLASSNKTHSPKDILKGLTNLIQSASADKEDGQKKDKFPSFLSSDPFEPQTGMSTFIKSIIPSVSKSPQISSSPSTFFNTSHQSTTSAPARTVAGSQTTTVNSYQTTSYNNVPAYSSRSQLRSFIPSLVPSNPQDNFFPAQSFPTDEYNPEIEIFDTEMDLDPCEDSDSDVPSPDHEPLSPVTDNPVAEAVDVPRPIAERRLSTLITLVTDDSHEGSLPENKSLSDDAYKSDKENFTEGAPHWFDTSNNIPSVAGSIPPPQPHLTEDFFINKEPDTGSLTEDYFINKQPETSLPAFYTSAPPPPLPPVMSPPNGQDNMFMNPISTVTDPPLSRIETIQSQRQGPPNGQWFNDNNSNWHDDRRNPPGPPPFRHGRPPNGPFFNDNRDFVPRQFQPRQRWDHRDREDNHFHQKRNYPYAPRPFGSPQNKRMSFRGRGGRW
ncbi:regulation of nuclear pre-mRNA domain-containing protein 2 isoform X1 [Parasteatoda tepidariorum]|uniref:regulation of nuclear pre-mRNA domain-containing protein 2 isoform X1 n=2 Tax=Parasteatoda tepidariorum TaxID=114398 RepID=UPI0039BC71B7